MNNTPGTTKKESNSSEKTAYRVSAVSIAVNLLLSAAKLFAGIVAHSGAMVSDAVHSASDVFSTFIVIAGVKISNKSADTNHRYGHERMECVASILLAVFLFLTGAGIGLNGVETILNRDTAPIVVPGLLALVMAVISIVVKEWMYWYTRGAAKKINSGALMADAWHHRSDALSSVGAFVGIFGARLGFPILDPIASIVICVFIAKAAYDVFKDAIDKLVDTACDPATVEQMRSVILEQDGVCGIDDLRTRLFGSKIYVDVEISVDGSLVLRDAHHIAEMVHDKIEENFQDVKHCMVHVNPNDERH